MPDRPDTAERIRIRGQVQGVGFRPFVWRLAAAHGVLGEVLNDGEGVLIHAEGRSLDAFATALRSEAPPLARIDSLERSPAARRPGLAGFAIVATAVGTVRTRVTPDAIICPDCRAEIADPAERRYRYPFANCTHCGPRLSIVERVPYDRGATTMRQFPMCHACCTEYEDPADRRFHAQPIACPVCGPRAWVEAGGCEIAGDAITEAAQRLRAGEILAVKGLGGFHLACDARNEAAVARLRQRKRRPGKPFALMAADLSMVRAHAKASEAEAALLGSSAAPIVLLETRGTPLAPSVAPGHWTLGWMVPTTPLHLLLMEAFGGPLVMTSGNLSGEPQVIGNDEARAKLTPFVDAFLMHNRDIARRLDDSVATVAAGRPRVLRRARGYAPGTLALAEGFGAAPPVTAYGALLKSAICLLRDGEALLSHHLGDLSDLLTAEEFAKADQDYAALFDHAPEVIACDLHPDHHSTTHAEARAAEAGLPIERVQHHHAHVAAAMAEAGWRLDAGPVIGIALDGLGLGPDGTVWGGEVLLADYRSFERLGCLRPVPLPGGDAAQREPWRNLLAQLDAAGLATEADEILTGRPLAPLRAAMAKGVNAPLSSSAGRLFDAVAAAAGLAPERQSYEGEAAMLLEAASRPHLSAAEPFEFATERAGGLTVLDPAPLWAALLADRAGRAEPGLIGARFHKGLVQAVSALARDMVARTGAGAVALTGGVMQNCTLLELLMVELADLTLLTHGETPPNDGSVALGQAAVAAARVLR